jgi:hypothetical protein
MMILNYTTKVPAARTVSEIQAILGAKGACRVSVDYENGRAAAMTFGLKIGGSEVGFRLPCNVEGVAQAIKKSNPKGSLWRDTAQVERIAWRIVKDWIEAQVALVEAAQAEMAEVFLPYAVHNDGQTFFQHFKSNQLRLTSGGEAEGGG